MKGIPRVGFFRVTAAIFASACMATSAFADDSQTCKGFARNNFDHIGRMLDQGGSPGLLDLSRAEYQSGSLKTRDLVCLYMGTFRTKGDHMVSIELSTREIDGALIMKVGILPRYLNFLKS